MNSGSKYLKSILIDFENRSTGAHTQNAQLLDTAKVWTSVAVSAEILLMSPQKLFLYVIKTYIDRIKASKNKLI